ncbi:uncharacterized protein UV8b_05155 [Ustilaginoidea virens]|uniref:Amine oxidase domain-containing protein n=1 Tax=Ustilaginoidea virens TaxID=1159556 RepID=A0A8E5HSN7_USTVR|nr:uncharacterized protein UV8b_05155 [Ustilaginoidea virens]QUC20914.1 hypothetical protein UV8b_05155 [Ustilaginoidea virens]
MYSGCSLLAAVAALSVQSSFAYVARAPRHGECKKTKVAILGAGTAGIAAARALSNSSVSDFVIIEYNDRVGGRVTQTNFGRKKDGSPYVVELGANWIQGLGSPGGPQNPVWTMAQKYGLKNTFSDYNSILTYDESGYNNYSSLLAEYQAAWDKASIKAGRMLADNIQDETARAGLSLAGWNPKHSDMHRQAVEWWSWDWDAALTPEESSLIFGAAGNNLTFNQFSDQNNMVIDPRGYRHIIEQESRTFLGPNDRRLLLKTQVTNITYSDDGVTVHTSDGSCISAAYAICTFSLGVLQNEAVGFAPPLPEWKRTAVSKFSMGTYTKLFMQFNETFWPGDTQYLLYASPTKRGYFPMWESLSGEGFLRGSNILFATVTGDESYRLEQQTDEQTKGEMMAVLRQMFPNVTVPEPTAFLYPRWTSTPWAYGSYSNWPIGTTLEMHQNLRANTGRLWFAGEATSAEYFGFVHGAWFEGVEAGAHVAALVQKRCARVHNVGQCGGRPHYDELLGTSALEEYNALNGWAVSSFYRSS